MKSNVLALAAALLCGASNAQGVLDWTVENRFPLLKDKAFENVVRMWASSPDRSMWGFIRNRLEMLEAGPREE